MNNKQIINDFFIEVYNKRNLDYIKKYFSKDYFEHTPTGARSNLDAIAIVQNALTIFPDLSCKINDLVEEKDMVFVRLTITVTQEGEFLGLTPTNKTITFEAMEQFKLVNGIVTESWGAWPLYDMIEKLKK